VVTKENQRAASVPPAKASGNATPLDLRVPIIAPLLQANMQVAPVIQVAAMIG